MNVIGIYKCPVKMLDIVVPLKLFVAPNNTMSFSVLLGRDFSFLESFNIKFGENVQIFKKSNSVNWWNFWVNVNRYFWS